MTYTPLDPTTFLTTTLPKIHPRPADPYEAALRSRHLAHLTSRPSAPKTSRAENTASSGPKKPTTR